MPRTTSVQTAPPTTKSALRDRFKDFPAIDVIERRYLNPNDPGSLPILLNDEHPDACSNTEHQPKLKPGATKCACGKPARRWHLRWCNTSEPGRWSNMKSKGYLPVPLDRLMDREDISDLVKQKEEGGAIYVRRGDRGQEVLMYQPLEAYSRIKALQLQARTARGKSRAALRDDLAEAASQDADGLGSLRDEAADTIMRGGIQVESMTRSRTTLGEEAKE